MGFARNVGLAAPVGADELACYYFLLR